MDRFRITRSAHHRHWGPVAKHWGLLLMLACSPAVAEADDWPMFRHDAARSGSSTVSLDVPLKLIWQVSPAARPRPAWPAPAAGNLLQRITVLHDSETADLAPHVVAAADRCWYASSAADMVYCRDLASGRLLWSYPTGGPVRLPPAFADGRVFAGADDGHLVCLDAADGRLLWQDRIGPEDRWIPGNSRLISRWPVRSGPIIAGGRVCVGAGVFPADGVFLACLDAMTGKAVWRRTIDTVASGPMVASADRLFVQSMRSPPSAFDLASGKSLGPIEGGGSIAALWKDQVVSGPSEIGKVTGIDRSVLQALADTTNFQFTVRDQSLYAATHEAIAAVSSDLKVRWKKKRTGTHSLITAGDLLLAGGDGEVSAYRATDGERIWQSPIEGRALGLSTATGRLLVSTDQGNIYCFGSDRPGHESSGAPGQQSDGPLAGAADRAVSEPSARLAKALAKITRSAAGYALVIEPPDHDLLAALARETSHQLIGGYRDAETAQRARTDLAQRGLLGTRATALPISEDWTGYPEQAFNLVVVFGPSNSVQRSTDRLAPLLQPYNGTLVVAMPREGDGKGADKQRASDQPVADGGDTAAWSTVTTDDFVLRVYHARPPQGYGEWSHPYADAGNTACSQDDRVAGPFELQWFGPPGPQYMVDRHNRTSPPLFRDGRLFVPGVDRLTAVDAYNGTILWDKELPGSTRIAVSKNSGHVVAGADHIFVAQGPRCLALDAASGNVARTINIPRTDGSAEKEWGYLALTGDLLLGSVSRKEAARHQLTSDSWQMGYLDQQPLVVSDAVFAQRTDADSILWQYRPQAGAVVNTTLAAGDGRVYFVESADPDTLKADTGRVQLTKLLGQGASLVALRTDSGEVAWRQPLQLAAQHSLFLTVAQDKVVLCGSRNEGGELACDINAYDIKSGKPLWKLPQLTGLKVGGSHGEQEQHPLVVGNTLYFKTFACDLATGKPLRTWHVPVVGCGALSASLHTAFFRAGTASSTDLASVENRELTGVTRPGCWLNMLPAGGLLLAPESSAGCTCTQYSLQTSLALRPLAAAAPLVSAGLGMGGVDERLDGDIEYVGRLRVTLKVPDPDAKIHYTLDGSWPVSTSPTYDGSLVVDRAATLRARAYRGDRPGGIARRELRCVEVPRLTSPTTTFVTSAVLEFARYPGDAVIRYELDGRSLTAQSPVYERPQEITASSRIRAAYFSDTQRLGRDLEVEFRKVPGRTPDRPEATVQGLAYAYFEGDDWKKLPAMNQMTPLRTGTAPRIEIPADHRPDGFAVRYRGYLEVPVDGMYTFYLISDDGSELLIGDDLVISHDGIHDARGERRAMAPLAAGKHRIEIRYFDVAAGEVLLIRWSGPGIGKQAIPAKALWHDADAK